MTQSCEHKIANLFNVDVAAMLLHDCIANQLGRCILQAPQNKSTCYCMTVTACIRVLTGTSEHVNMLLHANHCMYSGVDRHLRTSQHVTA